MTAIAERRRQRTVMGAVVAIVLVMSASVMFVVGAITLSNSQEGEVVGIDERPREQFPSTPNALLAIEDDDGDLASLVVMTLLPSGQGGSIVLIPVNADATSGFGDEPRPLDAEFDSDDLAAFAASVGDMLSISLERAVVVDPVVLESLIDPVGTVAAVVSTEDSEGDGELTDEPTIARPLTPAESAAVLSAPAASSSTVNDNDVAVWEALAAAAPLVSPPEPVPTDDFGRPIEPTTVEGLIDRLFEGPVGVRSVALAEEQPLDAEASGAVVLDRRDSSFVFAQVSPALVSTPNPGLKIRVVAPQTAEQLEAGDGLFASSSEMVVEFIGQMLFLRNNVVSVDIAPTGAPDVTIIEVTDPRKFEQVEDSAIDLFGEAEVRLADVVLEGVDIEVTLGMSYLAREAGRLEDLRSSDDLAQADDSGEQTSIGSVPDSATGTVVDDG